MKKLFYYLISTFILLIVVSSCKKNENNFPIQVTQPTTYICTGKNSNSFYPLAIDNEWTYPGAFNDLVVFIRQSKTIGTHSYFEIRRNNFAQDGFFREDTNADILQIDTITGLESVYLPGNPILNEEWQTSSGSRKITSINATVTTSHCTYDNCVEYTFKDDLGNTTMVEYYKRGIGKVSYTTYPPPGFGNPIKWDLKELILNE